MVYFPFVKVVYIVFFWLFMSNLFLNKDIPLVFNKIYAQCFGCRKVMLRVDAKQGAPKDGNSPLELFQVIEFSAVQVCTRYYAKPNARKTKVVF